MDFKIIVQLALELLRAAINEGWLDEVLGHEPDVNSKRSNTTPKNPQPMKKE